MSKRIVLIGGTGFFGERLARRLVELDDIELVVTSRDAARAERLVDALKRARPGASVTASAFDRRTDGMAERLASLQPFLVIDASGPFQGASYELARAALEAGAHWIDLADARDYLLGFEAALAPLALEKGLVALAGASSTPALSFAAVEDVTRNWKRIDTVDIAVMPGGAAKVGQAVIGAILHYAGAPIRSFEEARPSEVIGWGSIRRIETPNMGRRLVSPAETADADLLPKHFHIASRVTFSAGLESRLEQLSIRGLAALRRMGLIKNLLPLAPLLWTARRLTSMYAADRGGMTVDCAGLDPAGRPIWARWWMHAVEGEGPNVPILPALALTRKIIAGSVASTAGPAVAVMSLAEIEAEMPRSAITTSRHVVSSGSQGLLASSCDPKQYAALPARLRQFHEGTGLPVWKGRANVVSSKNPIAILIRKLFGFPPTGRNVPVTVTVDRKGANERWTRNFAGYRFASELSPKAPGIIAELFNPFHILLRMEFRDGQICMPVEGARLGAFPFPHFLVPRSDTREFVDDKGRFNFDVAISLAPLGLVAHYRGWLEPVEAADAGLISTRPAEEARAS